MKKKKRILTACDKACWRWWWYLRPSHLIWIMSDRVGVGVAAIEQIKKDERARIVIVGALDKFISQRVLCWLGIHYYCDETGCHPLDMRCVRCRKIPERWECSSVLPKVSEEFEEAVRRLL